MHQFPFATIITTTIPTPTTQDTHMVLITTTSFTCNNSMGMDTDRIPNQLHPPPPHPHLLNQKNNNTRLIKADHSCFHFPKVDLAIRMRAWCHLLLMKLTNCIISICMSVWHYCRCGKLGRNVCLPRVG